MGKAAVAKKETFDNFRDAVARISHKLAEWMPAHVKVADVMRTAWLAKQKDSKLARCSTESIMVTLCEAAGMGLKIGGTRPGIYPVPYGQICTPIVSYYGWIELMERTGTVAQVDADIVAVDDEWEYAKGSDPRIVHRPSRRTEPPSPNNTIAAYCVIHRTNGAKKIEWMWTADIEAVRKRSKASSGPWSTDWGEMAKKTVIRRASKHVPTSDEIQRAAEIDEVPARLPAETIDVPASASESLLSELTSRQEGGEEPPAVGGKSDIRGDASDPSSSSLFDTDEPPEEVH